MLICPPPPILESRLLFSVSESNLIGNCSCWVFSLVAMSHWSILDFLILLLTQILESKLLFFGFVSLGSEINFIAIGRKSVV